MTRAVWISLLTVIAGGGLTALAQALSTALPQYAITIASIVGILVAIAGFVLTTINRANAPATSILADAPSVLHDGTQIGTNVSTTSTATIAAPTTGGVTLKRPPE